MPSLNSPDSSSTVLVVGETNKEGKRGKDFRPWSVREGVSPSQKFTERPVSVPRLCLAFIAAIMNQETA